MLSMVKRQKNAPVEKCSMYGNLQVSYCTRMMGVPMHETAVYLYTQMYLYQKSKKHSSILQTLQSQNITGIKNNSHVY